MDVFKRRGRGVCGGDVTLSSTEVIESVFEGIFMLVNVLVTQLFSSPLQLVT